MGKELSNRDSHCSDHLTSSQILNPREIAQHSVPRATHRSSNSTISLAIHHPSFSSVIGSQPRHSLILSSDTSSKNPFFHAACIYLPDNDELYTTSDVLQPASASALPLILISKVRLSRDAATGTVDSVEWQKLRPPSNMAMPAGGVVYEKGMLFCAQGSMASSGTGSAPSGLFYMPRGRPPEAVVTGFHHRDFNSVRDVAVAKDDGALWFTDPCGGFDRDFRPSPGLPCLVYRYDPRNGELRAVADGLGRPSGIAFSPDGGTLYVSDGDAIRGSGDVDYTRSACIYAFDVVSRSQSPFLANKRVFALALQGVPAAIRCDVQGWIYAGCGDGVEVWNPGGTLLGVIEVPGGVTSLTFGKDGEMFLCSKQRLWRVKL